MNHSASVPALSSSRSQVPGSARSRMSQKRRERLRDIHRRAQLQDTLKEKLMQTYGSQFKESARAQRVIAEEVSKVVSAPVISHIDIENLQQKVERRAKLPPGAHTARSTASTKASRAGRSVIGTAKFTPRALPGLSLRPGSRAGLGSARSRSHAALPASGRRSSSTSRRSSKLRQMGRSLTSARGGGSSTLPSITGSAAAAAAASGSPQPESAGGSSRMTALEREVEREKWKHTAGTMYGSFAAEEELAILPSKPKRIGPEDRASVEWTLLQQMEADKAAAAEEEKAREVLRLRDEHNAFLSKQCEEKEAKARAAKAQQMKWAEQQLAQLKAADERDRQLRLARQAKEAEDRAKFDAALREAMEQKRKAKELEKKADVAYAQGAARAVAEAEAAEKARIEAERTRFKSFIAANEAEQAKKEAIKLREAEEDYKRMLAYMKLMDEQEQARVEAFKEFERKTKRRFEMSLDTKAKERAMIELEERRIEEAEAKFIKQEHERAAKKAAKLKAAREEQLRVLAQQIGEKKRQRELARLEGQREADEVTRKIAAAQKEEQDKKQKERAKNMRHRIELERQIRSNAKMPVDPYFHMSDTERLLNRNKLVEAHEHASARQSQYGGGSSRRSRR